MATLIGSILLALLAFDTRHYDTTPTPESAILLMLGGYFAYTVMTSRHGVGDGDET